MLLQQNTQNAGGGYPSRVSTRDLAQLSAFTRSSRSKGMLSFSLSGRSRPKAAGHPPVELAVGHATRDLGLAHRSANERTEISLDYLT
jgi:hypothetical protein